MKITLLNAVKKIAARYGVGRGKKYTLQEAKAENLLMHKLHLGCGNIHINGWCNVDVIKTGATDLILDIATLPGIPENSVHSIYSCHVLEHFSTGSIPKILERWHSVMRAGGELRISVPDLDAITRIYQKNIDHFQVLGHQPWIALIYGGQKDQYDFHKTGFNFNWLSYLLKNAGFNQIEEYPHAPHFIAGVFDNSLADAPFGEYISLNIRAVKNSPH
jgi:predicted SAM-dependent methyltransferase